MAAAGIAALAVSRRPVRRADSDLVMSWLDSPEWTENPDGDDVGAIARERCDRATTTCAVHLVPPPGEQPEHFVRARLDEPSYDGDDTEVEVRLDNRQYVTPDWEVSSETVERAMAIPVLDACPRRHHRLDDQQRRDLRTVLRRAGVVHPRRPGRMAGRTPMDRAGKRRAVWSD